MTLRSRVPSALLIAAAFAVTPSPMTQGQSNGLHFGRHVDQPVFDISALPEAVTTLDRVDATVLDEVERLSAS